MFSQNQKKIKNNLSKQVFCFLFLKTICVYLYFYKTLQNCFLFFNLKTIFKNKFRKS